MRMPIQLGAQSAEAEAPPVSIERLINGYLEATPKGRSPTPIYGTPGFTAFATPTGSVRAMIETAGALYIVADQLCEVLSDGTVSEKGAIPAGTVDIASDGTNVVVTVNGGIWVWNGTVLAEVTDEDAPEAGSVEWMNGFFVFTEDDTEQFFISPMNNPSGDFDALDFDSSDVQPDKLVRSRRLGRTLLMMGRQSIEFWLYTGDNVFPFERYQDDPLDVGLIGPHAEATTNETVFLLAHDKTVRRLDGRTATRISTFGVEKEISGWADASVTVVTSHVWQGHLFVVFRNPDGCVVWDQSTQLWHERQSEGSPTWAVSHYAYAFGKHLVGGARLYELGGYDEDGAVLPLEMLTPWVDNGGERFSINDVEIRLEAGVGSLTLNPRITLCRTEDGEEFTTPLIRPFGKQGDRFRRVNFGRQGMSRGAAFKIRITDPVRRAIYAMYADVG